MRNDRDKQFKQRDAERRAKEKSAATERKAERALLRRAADEHDPAARVAAAVGGRAVAGGNPFDALLAPFANRRAVERDSARELLAAVAAHSVLLDPGDGGVAWAGPVLATVDFRGRWRRRPRDWRGRGGRGTDPRRQFSQLLRFLFADYPLAAFWDEPFVDRGLWLDTPDARRWFVDVAQGRSLRELQGFPIELTRRAAHALATGPADRSLAESIRRAQVVGSGGDERLAGAINGSRLGRQFFDAPAEAFWAEVIRFLSAAGLLEAREVGPLVDYLHHLRFEPAGPGLPPARPDLSMAGRSPAALVRQVREWHASLNARALRRRRGDPPQRRDPRPTRPQYAIPAWPPCGIAGYVARRSLPDRDVVDEVVELTTDQQLRQEGAAMAHCVASYAVRCATGVSAVFSFRQDATRVLTVEVVPQTRRLVQARGPRNRPPTPAELRVLKTWAGRVGLTVDRHVGGEGW